MCGRRAGNEDHPVRIMFGVHYFCSCFVWRVCRLRLTVLVSEPDPRKIEKEGLVFRMGWKCTLRPVCRRTSDWLLINILMCVYWNANHTRAIFAFCFVLESCKHQAGKIRTLLRVSGSAESSTGYGRFSN